MMNRYRLGGNSSRRQPDCVGDIEQAAARVSDILAQPPPAAIKPAGKPDISDRITDMSDKTAAGGGKMPVFRQVTGAMSDILPQAAGRSGSLGRFSRRLAAIKSLEKRIYWTE